MNLNLHHVRFPTVATLYQTHSERWLRHMLHSDNCLLDFFPKVLDLKLIWHYRYGMKFDKGKKTIGLLSLVFHTLLFNTKILRQHEFSVNQNTKILRKPKIPVKQNTTIIRRSSSSRIRYRKKEKRASGTKNTDWSRNHKIVLSNDKPSLVRKVIQVYSIKKKCGGRWDFWKKTHLPALFISPGWLF